MMSSSVPEDILMAYADGALSPGEAARVEALIAVDPDLQRQVAAHRALKAEVFGAFAPVLDQPVPDRLTATLARSRSPGPPAWAAMAAALVVGVLSGAGLAGQFWGARSLTGGEAGLEARGALKAALETRLASNTDAATAQVGLSFRSGGRYCRTFDVAGDQPWAGVACKEDGDWRIQTALRTEVDASAPGSYRQASSGLPPQIMAAVEAMIDGRPLERAEEQAAAAQGWTAPER
jgi:hypothetical protein